MEIWAATRDPAAADHPFPAPYSVQTLRDELQMRPVVLRDGELEEVEPLSGGAEHEFPEPVGRARGIYTLHSELATLPLSLPTLREASFRLCLSPGLLEKLLALGEGELPEPYTQSSESVAVHEVEVRGVDTRVAGRTVTSGGSARSTSEPAARGAVELAEGRLETWGVHPPELAVADPEAFLALLDTEVSWVGPWSDAKLRQTRHVFLATLPPMATKTATPWGPATVLEELSVQQRSGEKRFASVVQLLVGAKGERLVRFAYSTDGTARRGPVTLRARDVQRLVDGLARCPQLAETLGFPGMKEGANGKA
jgi:hypothetical protein